MTPEEIEGRLRHELWVNHGHDYLALYGDDGEMQCSQCLMDFKRAPLEVVCEVVARSRLRRAASVIEVNRGHERSAMSASVTSFAIAEQSPGSVKFSITAAGHAAPAGLVAKLTGYDENSEPISEQSHPIGGWVSSNGQWLAYVQFDTSAFSGKSAFCEVDAPNQKKPAASFSLIAP